MFLLTKQYDFLQGVFPVRFDVKVTAFHKKNINCGSGSFLV